MAGEEHRLGALAKGMAEETVPRGRAMKLAGAALLGPALGLFAADDAEAIVIGGNGLRAVGAIAALEEDPGRPGVTANQALLWAALRVADVDPGSVVGHGRLFGHG